MLDTGPGLDVEAAEAGHVGQEVTYRGHKAEVGGRVEAEAGDGVTAEEGGPAGEDLAPQQRPPPVILGLGARA